MQVKNILLIVGVTVGVLAGMTALLWNYSETGGQVIEDVAGVKRHVLGEGEIVITEWSDLQCPACAGVQEPLKELLAKYDGQVKLVFRHFPLTSIHPNAMAAGIFAEAAATQGKFWEAHDKLYQTQEEWSELEEPVSKFYEYASELGLDIESLKAEMKNEEHKQAILLDSTEAIRYRIQGTPTFFLDGERVTFPELEVRIKSKLSE